MPGFAWALPANFDSYILEMYRVKKIGFNEKLNTKIMLTMVSILKLIYALKVVFRLSKLDGLKGHSVR